GSPSTSRPTLSASDRPPRYPSGPAARCCSAPPASPPTRPKQADQRSPPARTETPARPNDHGYPQPVLSYLPPPVVSATEQSQRPGPPPGGQPLDPRACRGAPAPPPVARTIVAPGTAAIVPTG